MPSVVPIGIGCLVVLSALSRAKKKARPGMSADQKAAFARFMNEVSDPKALRELSGEFGKEGFKAEAHMLEVKAKRCELPQEKKDERRRIFREAMALKDPEAVEEFAKAFEDEYCVGAARALYDLARGLRGVPKLDDTYITEAEKEEPPKVRVESPKEETKPEPESHVSPEPTGTEEKPKAKKRATA